MAGPDNPKPRLICIVGPTGVGKTRMALELAGRWGGEIIGADSMQVYRQMDIGTAKPTREERIRIRHHLLDVVDPNESFDASLYVGLARRAIGELQRLRKPVFVVGGTGLYIRALLGGLIDGPGADDVLRHELRQEMADRGKVHLYGRLLARDPRAAARIDPHDGVRIIRALEALELTGRSIVEHQQEHRFADAPYEALRIGLRLDRKRLNDRIDQRTERMIADGFPEEVRRLLDRGWGESLKSMQSLGYRHMIDFLAGRQGLDQTVELIKRDTRRYARRQMTWFVADHEVGWLDPEDIEAAFARIGPFLDRP
jgi:tRNA dimethylallyltransferase